MRGRGPERWASAVSAERPAVMGWIRSSLGAERRGRYRPRRSALRSPALVREGFDRHHLGRQRQARGRRRRHRVGWRDLPGQQCVDGVAERVGSHRDRVQVTAEGGRLRVAHPGHVVAGGDAVEGQGQSLEDHRAPFRCVAAPHRPAVLACLGLAHVTSATAVASISTSSGGNARRETPRSVAVGRHPASLSRATRTSCAARKASTSVV